MNGWDGIVQFLLSRALVGYFFNMNPIRNRRHYSRTLERVSAFVSLAIGLNNRYGICLARRELDLTRIICNPPLIGLLI